MVHRFVTSPRGRSDQGGISLVAIFLVVLFAMTAIVVDLGNTRQIKRQEQNAVDAGALAGARELDVPAVPTAIEQDAARTIAARYAAGSLFDGSPPAVDEVGCPGGGSPGSTCFAVGDAAVRVTTPYDVPDSGAPPHRLLRVEVCRDVVNFFGGIIGTSSFRPCASAVGKVVAGVATIPRGVVVLDPDGSAALLKEGNATLTVVGGHVMVNSSDGGAAQCNSANGGVFTPGGSTMIGGGRAGASCIHPAELTGVAAIDDPLGSLPTPDPSTLWNVTVDGSSTVELVPGRYASPVAISGGGRTITFQPGVYWFDAGFSCNGAAKSLVSAPGGVFIFVAGGGIDITGSCAAMLSPMATGPYTGITIFQARGNTTPGLIAGNGTGFSGTIYLPAAELRVAGNGSQTFDDAMLVTYRVRISGNGAVTLNALEPVQAAGAGAGVRLED